MPPSPSPTDQFSSNKVVPIFQRGLLLFTILLLLTCTLVGQVDKEMPALEPGKPVLRELVGDASHSYTITLSANHFLHVVVEQKGIDVVVTLFAPDSKKLVEVDSPNGTQGPEPISTVTEVAGNYRLEVRSLEKTAAAGRYEVTVRELRAAKPQDKSRIAGQQAIAEAETLENEGSAASLHKAIRKYEEALPLWREANDRSKEAGTLYSLGSIYNLLGERQKSLAHLKQALLLFRAVGDSYGEATTLNSLGVVINSLGETQKGLEYYNQALLLIRTIGDRGGEASTLSNIGTVYSTIGENQKALEYLNQALPLRRAAGDRSGEASTLNNIGHVYNELGESQKALDFFNHALLVFRAVGDRNEEATTLNNIGLVYYNLGENQKALDYLNEALPLSRAVGDRRGEASTFTNIGVVYSDMGENLKALDYLNQALPHFGAVGDPYGEAATLTGIGIVYNVLGEKQKALDHYNRALPLRRAVGDRRGEASTLNNIGFVYDSLGAQEKAIEFYNQSLLLNRAIEDRRGEANTLANIARVERDRGNLEEARSRVEAALTIFESLRTKITSKGLRSSYFATVQKFYDFYVDLLMRLHKEKPSAGYDGKALQASERGRARSLLETLAEASADIRRGIDPKLVDRERSLQQQLNAKAQSQMKLLNGPHTDAQAEAMAKEITGLTTTYQEVEAEIRRTSPAYAALTQPEPLSLKEIQTQVLDRNSLLLEYSLGEERSYLWAATPTSISSYELPGRAEIESRARKVYELLNARNIKVDGETDVQRNKRVTQADLQFAGAVASLSKLLIAPVRSELAGKRLLIVTDGALQYIPFGALVDPTTARPGKSAPLVVRHEIISLPSASTLAVLRKEVQGRAPAPKTVVVLADPVFESNDVRVSKNAQLPSSATNNEATQENKRELPLGLVRSAEESSVRKAGMIIPRLPGTRTEANQILALAPAIERMGAFDFLANRQTATSDELSKYRYVHFATHGFLNSVHPELSGLVFSMVNEKGQPQDGFLRAHEIFNLKLSADVVVLSACQTGLGKEIKGEGIVGMTRGFMYAGSPRVVVSLWSVSDQATAELMTRFYRGMLKDKMRPAAALRAAQVSLMKEKKWESPFYWAAFTLQGEWK